MEKLKLRQSEGRSSLSLRQRPSLRPETIRKAIFAAFLGGLVILMTHGLGLSWQAGIAIGVTLGTLFLNACTDLPADMVFLGGLALLLVSGVLSVEDGLAGFSNPGMVTVGVLFIVIAGVDQTGGMTWISQNLLGLPKGQTAALVRLLFPIVGMSAFLNNTPIVAMFVPVVSDWAKKLRISPSKLMIPLSYGAIFGGICTLIGTSTNLVVNGLIISQAKLPGLGLFDVTPVSLPCAIAGCIYLLTIGHRLLPNRQAAISDQDDLRKYSIEMVVEPNSPLAQKTIEQAGLRHLPGLYLGMIIRGDRAITAVSPQERLREGDQLVFMGMVDSIVDLKKMRGLRLSTNQLQKLDAAPTERCLIEAVVSGRSPLAGKTIRDGQFRKRYNAVVLAAARNGDRIEGKIGDICLQPGDSLLLEAHPSFLNTQRASRDFYLISGVPDSAPLRHDKAPLALVILFVMVLVVTLGWMDMLLGAVMAALLMVVTRCCSMERALRGIDWSLLMVIAAALGIGKALEATGAAEAIAGLILSPASQNPHLALTLVYAATTILTEVVTNNAAAALVFPVALSVSQSLGVNFMPFAIAVMLGASASFATPIGYQTNLMVYGPGGYRFTDFMRVGIPLNLIFWVITVILAPHFFPF